MLRGPLCEDIRDIEPYAILRVEALSSDRHGPAAVCILNTPGCRAFGLLLPEYVIPKRMAVAAVCTGPEALGDANGCAGSAATLGEGLASPPLP